MGVHHGSGKLVVSLWRLLFLPQLFDDRFHDVTRPVGTKHANHGKEPKERLDELLRFKRHESVEPFFRQLDRGQYRHYFWSRSFGKEDICSFEAKTYLPRLGWRQFRSSMYEPEQQLCCIPGEWPGE
jgi:hypothetical protein